uniref:Uncharacterized protein n=1 Tax=Oryza punctata TaxID=4537 RepID=A0A0E0M673_ORYPU
MVAAVAAPLPGVVAVASLPLPDVEPMAVLSVLAADIIAHLENNNVDIKNHVQMLKRNIHITVDMSTDRIARNDIWQSLHISSIIWFILVPVSYTGDLICEVLPDWYIERRLSTITFDNCSTNDNLIK